MEENQAQFQIPILLDEKIFYQITNIPNTTTIKIEFIKRSFGSDNNYLSIMVKDNQTSSTKQIRIFDIFFSNILNQNGLNQNLIMLSIMDTYSNIKYNFDNLPSGLKILKLNVNQPLNNLPTGLKILDIVDTYTHELDNLPSSLEILQLKHYTKSLDNLPSSLIKLYVCAPYKNKILNLPWGLNSFAFADETNCNINLPPNIKSVWYYLDNNKLRRNLLKINPKVIYEDIKYFDSNNSYIDEENELLGLKNHITFDENIIQNYDESDDESDCDDNDNAKEFDSNKVLIYEKNLY